MIDLFEMALPAGACLFKDWLGDDLRPLIQAVSGQSPFRQMVTPGGYTMSVAITNCGAQGWISDRAGYRYQSIDPLTQKPWPEMPERFKSLASSAALQAGYPDFVPNCCLINRYRMGDKMSLHQDRDERDFGHPIVSLSLGLPAVFLFGGKSRKERPQKITLEHGDCLVWGGPSRLFFHGVMPLKDGNHPDFGQERINLTFRMTD